MRSFFSQSSLALLVAAIAITSAGCQTTGGWGMPKWPSLSNLNPMNWGKKNSSLASNSANEPIQPPSISHTPTMPNGGRPGGSNYGPGGSGTRGSYANNPYPGSQYPSQQTGGYDTGPYNTGTVANQTPYYGPGGAPSGGSNYGGASNGFYGEGGTAPGGGGYSSNYGNDAYRNADRRSDNYGGGSPAPYPSGPGAYSPGPSPSYNGGAPNNSPPPSGYNPGGAGGGYPEQDYGTGGGGNYGAPGFGSTDLPASDDDELTAEPKASFASTASLPASLIRRSGSYAPGSTRPAQLASAAGAFGGSSPSTFGHTESGSSPAKLPDYSSSSYDNGSSYSPGGSSFPIPQ